MFAAKMRYLLVALGVLVFAQGSMGQSTTFRIDPTLTNVEEMLPGLDGGAPRPIAVLAGPSGRLTEVAANEIIFHPRSEKELDAFLSKYGGKIVRDGTPFVSDPLPKDHPPLEPDGWYLIRIDPELSTIEDLEKNLGAGPHQGEYRFSSEEAARYFAIFLREQDLSIGPNLVMRPQAVLEHPDGMGGNLDASTFWWLTEDDNAVVPGDQGLSTGVIRAWSYLRYHQVPPTSGIWHPARIAIIDGGFALDETGAGLPLDGNLDYGIGMRQSDVVDHDGYAGGTNLMSCGGSPCPWHGQMAFGVAAAEPFNHFGGAGTGGPVVSPLLVRVSNDMWTFGDGIRTASLNGADVISLSLVAGCGDWDWVCHRVGPLDIYERIQNEVYLARSTGQVVVAAAGNDRVDITGVSDPIPCTLDGVICVGSVDGTGMNVYNYGSPVDIWAPTRILSTVTPESLAADADFTGIDEVATFGGTSASTPFIAGVVGLMKVLDPMITQQRVQDILQMTANPSPDPRVRTGWVDALRAVMEVRPNQPPVVQWSAPTSATVRWTGTSLEATASDPEVTAMPPGAHWPMDVAFSSNVNGPLCTDSDPPYACHSGELALGNHVITVTATDAFGATSTATRNFEVINHPPVPDIAEPLAAGTYFDHQPVRLEAYVPDPDEFIPQDAVEWSSDRDGVLGTGWSRDAMLTEGEHVLTVHATDQQGATGQDSVTITVQSGAGYPTVRILQPTSDLSVSPGTNLILQGEAIDPEDGVLTGSSLVWSSSIDGVIGTGNWVKVVLSGPAVPCHPEIVTHVVRLRATDSDGHSVEVTIRISVGTVC